MIILNKNSLQDYFSLLCKSLSHRQKLSIYYAIIAKNYKTGDFESLLFGISAITYWRVCENIEEQSESRRNSETSDL